MSVARQVAVLVDAAAPGTFLPTGAVTGSRPTVTTAWSREVKRRPELVRVHRGLYWKGVATRYGTTMPSTIRLAIEVLGEGCGPTGWSALSTLGLTTQVPASVDIAAVTRRATLEHVRVLHRENRARLGLTYLEVAALEVLRADWAPRADRDPIQRIAEMIGDGHLRLPVIEEAAAGEPRVVRVAIIELARRLSA